jgi:hypothetical protein
MLNYLLSLFEKVGKDMLLSLHSSVCSCETTRPLQKSYTESSQHFILDHKKYFVYNFEEYF